MTDRIKGVYVAFEEDIRIDDAEGIINAIRMVKHVAAVEPIVRNADDWINRKQVKQEIREKLFSLWNDI